MTVVVVCVWVMGVLVGFGLGLPHRYRWHLPSATVRPRVLCRAFPRVSSVSWFGAACPAAAGMYATFVITNLPANASSDTSSRRLVDSSALADLPGAIACPPDCPAPSRGVFITRLCQDPPPPPDVCFSDATSSQCLLGTSPDCSPCPDAAYCTSMPCAGPTCTYCRVAVLPWVVTPSAAHSLPRCFHVV